MDRIVLWDNQVFLPPELLQRRLDGRNEFRVVIAANFAASWTGPPPAAKSD